MFAAEFPVALNCLPKNSRGDLAPSDTVYGEVLGLISTRSVVRNPPMVPTSVPRSKSAYEFTVVISPSSVES